ncbi:SDR family oxidoreductase [Actinotalea sp. AC32]|nr:SDR family oxidoreductase [Actinotalea sp. AC32]
MRTTVVTGAASGIGRATADLLRSRGERVVGVDRHEADVLADLSTSQGRAAMVAQVDELTGGRVDAVLAIAGTANKGTADVTVNVFGAVATLEGLRPLLAGSPSPRAAVTSSMSSLLPHDALLVELCLAGDEPAAVARAEHLLATGQGRVIYGSTKRAVARWVRRAAPTAQWAGAGIPLNAVAPGIVETPMTADWISTPEKREKLQGQVPMPLHGFATPEVPARLLAWITSEENTHLCGQVVFVDGGADVVLRGDSTW